ncbi:MAG: hypothetical protein AAFQ16_09200 [Pseudomonadota bacterium]
MNDAFSIPGVLVTGDGKVRFTHSERPRIARLFARCGINIEDVKTVKDYAAARRLAAPHFMAWMASEIAKGPRCPEREQLLKVLESDR